MNQFVDAAFTESVQQLALGIESIDAAREQPLLTPVMLTFDDLLHGNVRPCLLRHPSNRHTLLYEDHYAGTARTVELRIFDQRERLYASAWDGRRFVPRRLRIALPTLAVAQSQPPASRVCRPHLHPGVAYTMNTIATGVRAHAMRAAAGPLPLRPARWVRVLATVPATEPDLDDSTVVGRAFGDDRGEFLLMLRFHVAAIGVEPLLSVRLRVFAPPEAVAATPELPAADPLWDLPIEQPATLADTDQVLRGETLPAGYVEAAQRTVQLPLGQLLRGLPHLLV